MLRTQYLWLAAFVAAACGGAGESRSREVGGRAIQTSELESDALAARTSWAEYAGRAAAAHEPDGESPFKIEPANLSDAEYASAELVPARRIVYRMQVAVPASLQPQKPVIAPPAGELLIDVSEQRLRARFVGPGWPVDEGSEVRLRGDVPGVYLFDADGGRPLGPGHLSGWFQGYPSGMRPYVELIIQDYAAGSNEGIGDLLCVFLAEWTHNSRDEVLHRCGGIVPPSFRFGIWNAELTAVVPLELAKSGLRADSINPPPIAPRRPHPLLDAWELVHISPLSARASEQALPPAADGGEALVIDNRTNVRSVVVVQGVAIGYASAGTRSTFLGLRPGAYRVAAMRTSNRELQASAVMFLPGELQVGHAPQPDQLAEPLPLPLPPPSSPDAAR